MYWGLLSSTGGCRLPGGCYVVGVAMYRGLLCICGFRGKNNPREDNSESKLAILSLLIKGLYCASGFKLQSGTQC